jgi:hypothetical protein
VDEHWGIASGAFGRSSSGKKTRVEAIEATAGIEPIEAIGGIEPIEPIEGIEPIQAIEGIEPIEAIGGIEPIEAIAGIEASFSTREPRTRRFPFLENARVKRSV